MEAKQPDDTIAAISTPPGEGGIGIVRLSGPESIQIIRQCFVSSSGSDIASTDKRVYHGLIRENGNTIDEVLVHVMRAPHSYTREDVVEVSGHGGACPLNALLELILRNGARLANPGEFTKRAFLHGRIDLVQAEAVIDRIRAQTNAALQAAAAAASGALSKKIHEISDELIDAKAYIEAAVDFPDDDLPELITPKLKDQLSSQLQKMRDLLRTADAGRLYREGASVAIVGRPNVGKSSLFNALLRDARAIVTPQPGTTRDRLEEAMALDGIPIRLTDTAGLRESANEIEKVGIDLARKTLHQSAALLFVIDAAKAIQPEDHSLAAELAPIDIPKILVLNKIDLENADTSIRVQGQFDHIVHISAQTGHGLATLEANLAEILRGGPQFAPDNPSITRLHQKESLRRAVEAAQRLLENFDASPEFLSIDLNEAILALGEITGETTPDDLLDRIFASFCIGK